MMPTLDAVLQTPQSRPTITNRGKGELEKDGQTGGGFDDVLAQSASKDEQSDPEAVQDTKSQKLVQIKNPRGFELPKSEVQTKVVVAEDKLVLPEKKSVDMATMPDGTIPTLKLRPDGKLVINQKPDLAEAGKQSANDFSKVEVAQPSLDIEAFPTKSVDFQPVDKSLLSATVEILGKSEKSEKPEKVGKPNSDKKTAALHEDTKAEDVGDGVKSLLDILASPTSNAPLLVDAQQTPPQNAMSEETMASMLQVVAPPDGTAKDKHVEGGDDKRSAKSSPAPDQSKGADTDKVFRFSRADGADKPIELRLSSKDKATDQSDAISTPQAKTENVVVLDARRYLALAPESNAFNLVSQIAGDKELSTALTSSIIDPAKTAATSKVVNTLKLQMTPHDLGTVTATLRLRGEELSVAITVQNSAAYNHLTSDQDKMVEALRAQGFAVDQVTVQLVSADRSASQDQQPQSNSQGQQQQARDGASAQQGRQQGNGASQDHDANRNWQNFDTSANSPAGAVVPGTADRRDGQVYL